MKSRHLSRTYLWAAISMGLVVITTRSLAETRRANLGLRYEAPRKSQQSIRKALADSRLFERTVAELNRIISVPTRIDVVFEPCSDANAFYDPDKSRITICYELVEEYLSLSSESTRGLAFNAAVFSLLHEIGHALVHVLRLPLEGSEEDAADELAALMALAMGREGEEIALSAMGHFVEMAKAIDSGGRKAAFVEEHSLDVERAGNVACIIYGSNPERYSGLLGTSPLSGRRAEVCPAEFQRRTSKWEELLGGHLAG